MSVATESSPLIEDVLRQLPDHQAALRVVLDPLPVLVALLDADGRCLLVNKAFERWYGARVEEIEGRHLRDVIDLATYETLREQVDAALSGLRVEVRVESPEKNHVRILDVTLVPYPGSEGRILGLVVFIQDVTEAVQATRRVQVLQQLTAALAAAKTLAEVAEVATEMFLPAIGAFGGGFVVPVPGRNELEPVGVVCPSEPERHKRRLPMNESLISVRAITERRPMYVEDVQAAYAHVPDGERELASDVLRGAAVPLIVGNRCFGAVCATFRERGPFSSEERRFLESFADQCALALERIRLSDEQQRTLRDLEADIAERSRLERRQHALYEMSRDLSRSAAPRDVARVMVSRAREALGASAAVVCQVADRSGVANLLGEAGYAGDLEAIQKISLDAPLPLSVAMRSNTALWIPDAESLKTAYPELSCTHRIPGCSLQAVAALPLCADGAVIGGVAFSFAEPHAFTPEDREFVLALAEQCSHAIERALALEAERAARERAESVLAQLAREAELRERLLGVVSHDLRSPLGAISITAERLVRKPALGEADFPALARIAGSARRMARMLEQILDYARIRYKGGLPMEPEPIDLRPVVEDIVGELRSAHPKSTLRVSIEGDCRGVWDADRLGEVISNLVGNAIKHGGSSPVDVLVDGTSEEVHIQVRNEGPPIPPELLPVIFEPFRSGQPGRSDSLGLGLYIAREIVNAHGGEIRISSSAATVVTVCLPRAAARVVPKAES